MNFYKFTLVVEAENPLGVYKLIDGILEETKTQDVWSLSDAEEMNDKEILEFFGKTKEEMLGE